MTKNDFDTFQLIARDDYSVGLGIMLEDVPWMKDEPMVAQSGLLIAHDIMEHPNGLKSIGSIDDELEALGGVHYIRGEPGQMSHKQFVQSNDSLKYDVAYLAEFFLRDIEFRHPWKNCADSDYFDFFEMIADDARYLIKDHIELEIEEGEDLSILTNRMEQFLRAVPHYMVMGYRKTRERFPCQDLACHMFWLIADTVDPYTKACEFEGQKYTLNINWKDEKVSCFYNEDDLFSEYDDLFNKDDDLLEE